MKSVGWLTWWTLGIVLLVRSGVGHAVSLSVVPTAPTVVRGQTFGVGLEMAGLGAFQPPSLSAWNLDLSFDATLLHLTTVTFGDPVLGDLVDLSGLATSFGLDVHFVSPAPVERHARVGGHPIPMASSPGFPLLRE